MKIEKVRIKNFRSFEKETVLKVKPGLNIIIGENNVGKSNIFIALNKLKHVLISREYILMRGNQGRAIFLKDDFSWGKSDEQIEIFVSLILNEKELDELIKLFTISYLKNIEDKRLENFKKEMGNKIEIFLKSNLKEKKLPYFKIGPLFFDIVNKASMDPNSFHLGSYEGIEWKNLIHSSFTGKRDFSEKIRVIEKDKVIEFKNKNISNFIIDIFSKKLKMFEEVRKKPEEKIKYEDEAIDGTEIANLLFRLKNGNLIDKERYRLIQEKFSELFPNLNLDVSYKNMKPLIYINPKGSRYEFSLEFIGTGVMEMIIFLTNIVALKGNVFLIEEPELHLHPSAQRLLSGMLQEYKNKNQFFLITHSPYLINIEDLTENILVKMEDGKSIIKQIPEKYLDEKEKSTIEKELDSGDKEMFFSSLVLLVEGETESGALPIFAKALDTDLDKNNVYICWVGGKKSFPVFQKILDVYDIPYIIVCDGDAQDIEIDENKLIVLDPDFEGILKRDGYEGSFIDAGKKVGKRSKPRKGRYVAKKIVELNREPPDEFKEIIKKVREMLGLEKKQK